MACSFCRCFICSSANLNLKKLNPKKVERLNAFDPIAGFYDALADTFFLGQIFKAQTHYLNRIKPGAKVLILGGGTGRILVPLFRQQPSAKVWYVEASAEMLKRSRDQLTGREEVVFIHGTEAGLPDQRFDVIILPFFLDMFEEPDLSHLCFKLLRNSKNGALWLVSDFLDSRWWHRSALFVMYRFFNLLCKVKPRRLPPWEQILGSVVGPHVEETSYFCGFITANIYLCSNTVGRLDET
jgi:tRNA (cmo5U34)-methyltransferase